MVSSLSNAIFENCTDIVTKSLQRTKNAEAIQKIETLRNWRYVDYNYFRNGPVL